MKWPSTVSFTQTQTDETFDTSEQYLSTLVLNIYSYQNYIIVSSDVLTISLSLPYQQFSSSLM